MRYGKYTLKGRVVYDRKTHAFKARDASRIIESIHDNFDDEELKKEAGYIRSIHYLSGRMYSRIAYMFIEPDPKFEPSEYTEAVRGQAHEFLEGFSKGIEQAFRSGVDSVLPGLGGVAGAVFGTVARFIISSVETIGWGKSYYKE